MAERRELTMKTYIGIDNGTSGSIGILKEDGAIYIPTPCKKEQDYTKKKKEISRLNVEEFISLLRDLESPFCVMERPLVNPTMFNTTLTAMRCFESQLTILETLKIPHMFIDSKEWQREMLPKGTSGKELKKASLDIGLRYFTTLENVIRKQKDADGLLIALWAKRREL